ncbi:rhodanese-like domain-containing protein [soil metagenome]
METKDISITVETLRNWLDEAKAVMILDVRPKEQREEWFIPKSVHYDVYDKLKQHHPNTFYGIDLPKNIPIVTVCAAGKTSEIAAELLEKKGHEVYSLEGGMKAWTLSWNTAKLKDGDLNIIQIRRTGKGCLSYMVASGSEVIVIDASVDIDVYRNIAREHGWEIKYVLDTHIHADHLSRSPELARNTGAKIFMPDQEMVKFKFKKIMDGDILQFGSSKLEAIHTPGHTLDSTTYFLNKKYLFTGDTLFIDGVGRPDLKADEDQARKRSSMLYDSLHKLSQLSEGSIVFPGHISRPVPFDKQIISSSIAEIKRNVNSLKLKKEDFIKNILSKIPPTPPNYLTVTEINLSGDIKNIDPKEIEAGANRCAIHRTP